MTDCACKKIQRVGGLLHSKFCDRYPNIRVGSEFLLDRAREGNLRAEISKHAMRVAKSHDWNHCRITDCPECRYVDENLDRDDDEGMVLP